MTPSYILFLILITLIPSPCHCATATTPNKRGDDQSSNSTGPGHAGGSLIHQGSSAIPTGSTCRRGNMAQYHASGPNCPPCWYREPGGGYSCYEYVPGTRHCPFPGSKRRPRPRKDTKSQGVLEVKSTVTCRDCRGKKGESMFPVFFSVSPLFF